MRMHLSGKAQLSLRLRKFLRTFSAGDVAESALLKLIFQNIAWPGIGDSGGLQPSATAGAFHIGLHFADPGETGLQTTNETIYTGYTRIPIVRSASGWDVVGSVCSNHAPFDFPLCTGGSQTLTYFSVGTVSSGSGEIIVSGALITPIPVVVGVTPGFDANQLDVTAD